VLNEDSVPIEDRRLVVEGVASTNTLERVRAGLPTMWPRTARCLLLSYSYADLPVGKTFEFVFPDRLPREFEETLAIVQAVTQQFGESFDSIPHGWKTICVVDFPQGVPRLIERLPAVEAWGESQETLALCGRDTIEALLSEVRKPKQ
jgi:hypothetical protein